MTRQSYHERLLLLGPDRDGSILAAVLDPEGGGVYSVVTARPASRQERRRYAQEKGSTLR